MKSTLSEQYLAVECAMATAYWLVKEGPPISKFGPLLRFLKQPKCPYIYSLSVSGNASYMSDVAANEMIDAMVKVVETKTDEMLKASPTVSILADEKY